MKKILIIVFLVIILLPLSSTAAHARDIAIIVNRENPIDELSFKDLVKILKQEKQYWKNGKKTYLIMQECGSFEKEIVLKKIYKMDDKELKKFWLARMFRGEISSFPKTLSSNEAVKRFVSSVPNAIGYIEAFFVDESVKVLRIDGKLPGQDNYQLSSGVGE